MSGAVIAFFFSLLVWGFYIALVLLGVLPIYLFVSTPLSPAVGSIAGAILGCSINTALLAFGDFEHYNSRDQGVIIWGSFGIAAVIGATIGFFTAVFERRNTVNEPRICLP